MPRKQKEHFLENSKIKYSGARNTYQCFFFKKNQDKIVLIEKLLEEKKAIGTHKYDFEIRGT